MNMGDKKSSLGNYEMDMHIRNHLIETGDLEALRLFDEEQAEIKRKARESLKQMVNDGWITEEDIKELE